LKQRKGKGAVSTNIGSLQLMEKANGALLKARRSAVIVGGIATGRERG
jgi:hypothetical protein